MASVIVALDFSSTDQAMEMVDRLGPEADFYKVGLELFTRAGPAVLRELRERDKQIFLDLKLLDIPNTVAGAVRAAAQEEVDLLTLHCTGGGSMMRAAVDAAAAGPTRLLGVTILTSMTVSEIEDSWGRELRSVRDEVIRLAQTAKDAGLDGVVASPLEAEPLKRRLGEESLVVTPGIRLAGGDAHDQDRVATPAAAARAGADYLVVGRTITGAPDPEAALAAVLADIRSGSSASRDPSAPPNPSTPSEHREVAS